MGEELENETSTPAISQLAAVVPVKKAYGVALSLM
jgi:hypothetical protein